MKTLRRILLTSAMAALTVGVSSATSIAGTCTTTGNGPTEISANTGCSKFNTNLGTLNFITLTINGSIAGTISLTNNAATTQNVRGTTNSEFDLNTTLQGFSGLTSGTALFTPTYNTGVQSIASGSTFTSGALAGSASTGSLVDSTGATFATYSSVGGAGTFTFNITTFSGVAIAGGGGQIASSQSTNGTVAATVAYDYTATSGVPEPATIALMGSALLGLGLVRRKVTK